MAACDTQVQPKMTEPNTSFTEGKGVINAADKEPNQTKPKSVRYRGPPPVAQAILPEQDLLTRFRHVYAGKGGWYGSRGAKGTGPINTGNIPNGFVSKYKREILRKLSKSLQAQASPQFNPGNGENKENNSSNGVKKTKSNATGNKRSVVDGGVNKIVIDIKQTNTDSSRLLSDPETTADNERDKTRSGESQRSPRGTDDGRSENSKVIEAVFDENSPGGTSEQYTIDEKRRSTSHGETLNAPPVNGSDESLTNKPLNYLQVDNIKRDINCIELSSAHVDTSNSEGILQGEYNAAHTVRSCPTRLGHKGQGVNSSKSSLGSSGKGQGGVQRGLAPVPVKKQSRTLRCKTNPVPGGKNKSKKILRSKSVKNVPGSDEAEQIRMTLFSRLSQEAQWAIHETRREMGVTPTPPRDNSPHPDSQVPSDASDPGDHGSVQDLTIYPDPPGEPSVELDGDPLDSQEAVQRSDSPDHYRDYDAMPGPNTSARRTPGQARPRKSPSVPDFSKRTGREGGFSRRRPGHIAETQISEIPMASMSKRRQSDRSSQLSHHSTTTRSRSYHGFAKTRLPEITSELEEERSRIADMDGQFNQQRRIPGVGQYKIVGTQAPVKREMTFEITPPGYDSRFDLPRQDLNVPDDTPEEVKQMAVAKCTEWLMKHFVS